MQNNHSSPDQKEKKDIKKVLSLIQVLIAAILIAWAIWAVATRNQDEAGSSADAAIIEETASGAVSEPEDSRAFRETALICWDIAL